MSIAYPRPTRQLSQELTSPDVVQEKRSALTWLRSPLWLCLLLALVARLWLIYHANGLIDSAEAQVGMQALRILQGEHPLYFYGQPSRGSLAAYIMAGFFKLAGPTVWTLRAETLLFSLLLVWLTWLLAGALAENAELSTVARRRFQSIAALIAALPPLYAVVTEIRVGSGYIETFVFSLLLLYWSVRLAQRWSRGIGLGESVLRWLGIGLVAGVGFWVDPQIALPLAVAALWLIGASFTSVLTAHRNAPFGMQAGDSRRERMGTLGRSWLTAIYALPAALLGLAPALYWGFRNNWGNVTRLILIALNVSGTNPNTLPRYATYPDQIQDATNNYLTCDAPRVLSGLLPNVSPRQESTLAQLLHPQGTTMLAYDGVLTIMLVCLGFAIVLYLLSYAIRNIGFIRALVTLPLLLGIGVTALFCLSNIATRYTFPYRCDADETGGYAALLTIVFPFLVATVFTLIGIGGDQASTRQQYLPTASGGLARRTGHPKLSPTAIVVKAILVIMCVAYVGAQGIIYATVPSDQYFRIPACKIALTQAEKITVYLQQEQIHYLWSNERIGSVLTFKTGAATIASDPHILTDHRPDPIPAYTKAVKEAEHASVAFFITSTDNLAGKLKVLDAEHILYNKMRFAVDQGIDLLIVTPLDHTFQPTEVTTLMAGEPSC